MSLSMSKVLQPLTTEGALAWSDQSWLGAINHKAFSRANPGYTPQNRLL